MYQKQIKKWGPVLSWYEKGPTLNGQSKRKLQGIGRIPQKKIVPPSQGRAKPVEKAEQTNDIQKTKELRVRWEGETAKTTFIICVKD